jgi:hypothetical protein
VYVLPVFLHPGLLCTRTRQCLHRPPYNRASTCSRHFSWIVCSSKMGPMDWLSWNVGTQLSAYAA